MSDQEIEELVQKHLPIRETEKERYGEVATPKHLIDEMLDALPVKVWSNTNYKWLDPAAGKGNFPAIVFARLNRGLAKRIPSAQTRKRHIINKMLYMVEINPDSADYLVELFGKTANIITDDFLENDQVASIAPHIIIGNPPFQKTKLAKYKGGLGNNTLWDKFILKSLDILDHQGYLGFITPSNWRRPESKLYNIMTNEMAQLKYLHIYGKRDARTIFGIQSRIDLYVLTKSHTPMPTIIIDEKGETHKDINPQEWPFLPNYDYSYINRILVERDQGIPVIYDSSLYDARKLSNRKTRKYKYPVVHTMTRKGLGIRYTNNRSKKHYGTPKVLLNANEKQYPYNDYQGKYGMSQLTFGIPIKNKTEGDEIVKRINTSRFQEMIRATKWAAFQTDHRLFHYITPNFRKWG